LAPLLNQCIELQNLELQENSLSTPTSNPQAFQNPSQEVSDILNSAFEEFTPERENLIRERCANSPLHVQLQKYLNHKNLNFEKD